MLVGRERELETILAVCRDAAAGRGSVLLVAGEPGIGKTALLTAAQHDDASRRTLRVTAVEAERTVAFATLQGLLWPLREELGELEARQAALLRAVLDLGPQVGASTFAVGAATLALLSVCSREEPLVAVVDDAHWADTPSQEVLCFVGRRLEHERIALLAGLRPEEPSLLIEERSFPRLELDRLQQPAARSLLDRAAAGHLAPAVVDRLLEACAGNPLGLVELPKLLSDAQRSGREPLPAALEAGPLVQRAFAARVAELGAAARAGLLLLAAAGESEPALAAMSPDERAALDEAEAAALLVRRGGVAFRHPLMQAAVYGMAEPARRREAHRRLASVAAGARRAWHLAEAVDGPDEDVAQALEEAAAEARLAGGVVAEAQALDRAAELTADDDRRARRLLAAARACRRAGRIEHADELLSQAFETARDPTTRAEVQLERGVSLERATAYREAYELLVGESKAAEERDPALAARLYSAAALAANQIREASPLEPARRAVELAGRRGDEIELDALFALVTARMNRPLPPDAEDDAIVSRAAALLERPELQSGEKPHWFAYVLVELEHEGRWLSDLALGQARAAGDVSSLCYGLFARAALELASGRVDSAQAWAAEALPLAEQIGEKWRREQAVAVRAEVEAARGNTEECELLIADRSNPHDQLHLGRALLAHARFEEAAARLEAAQTGLSGGGPRHWFRHIPLDLAEAYVGLGKRREAEAALSEAAPAIESCRLVRPRARLARVRALLAPERAVDAGFGAALSLLEDAQHPLEHGRIELCWGERLRAVGRSAEAVPHLERAVASFNALRASAWAERARNALEAASGIARPVQPRRSDVLTAQELRVARHAAAGLRDREIAAALYLSPRTVESYLHSAYRKLGVSNRTQLAGVLAADGVRPVEQAAPVPQVP